MRPRRVVQVFGADEQTDVDVDVLRWVRLAQLVVDEERVSAEAELSLIFVAPATIADLNERFLGGSGPTDVLSFPIDEDVPAGGRQPDAGGRGPGTDETDEPPLVLGDVLVCPAVAVRQAPEHGHSTEDEIALLVVHGVLHLLDYDHAEVDEARVMRSREQELLAKFRLAETGAGGPGTGAVVPGTGAGGPAA